MKNWQHSFLVLSLSAASLLLPPLSLADDISANDAPAPLPDNNAPDLPDPIEPDSTEPSDSATSDDAPLSPWSASLFYLYNFSNDQQLIVPTPGFEKNGFKANAQEAKFKFKKVKGFESAVSTNWSIGRDAQAQDKLLFSVNASLRKRVVVAVPFVTVKKGLSFISDYSQVSLGASSFIPTPWFYILPKYTATYNNADMNQFEYGVASQGWSSGWGVTLLKPINKNWTFLAIYSGKKLEESIQVNDEGKQSLMMILSYQFNEDFKF